MALLINEACTLCDACVPVCPNEAIKAGDPVYLIDPLKCTECVGGASRSSTAPRSRPRCAAGSAVPGRNARGSSRRANPGRFPVASTQSFFRNDSRSEGLKPAL